MDLEDAPQEDPNAGLSVGTVHAAFVLSAAVAVALTFGKDLIKGKLSTNSDVGGQTPQFKAFQRTYLTVYLLMMAGDWLQGPYMYALYDAYGFKHEEIAALFVAGFYFGADVNHVSTRLLDLVGGRVDGVHGGPASRQSSSSASTSSRERRRENNRWGTGRKNKRKPKRRLRLVHALRHRRRLPRRHVGKEARRFSLRRRLRGVVRDEALALLRGPHVRAGPGRHRHVVVVLGV